MHFQHSALRLFFILLLSTLFQPYKLQSESIPLEFGWIFPDRLLLFSEYVMSFMNRTTLTYYNTVSFVRQSHHCNVWWLSSEHAYSHTHRQRAVDVVTFYFFWHSILLWWLSTLSSHDHIVGICFVWTPYKRFHVWLVLLTRTVRHHQLSSYNHNVNIVQHFHYYVQNETNEYYMYIFCDNLPELKLYLIRIHHASTRSIERNVSAKEFWHS